MSTDLIPTSEVLTPSGHKGVPHLKAGEKLIRLNGGLRYGIEAEDSVIRYVVTKLDPSGTAERTLFDAHQGRFTYATAEEAQKRADAFKNDRHCKDMALEVRLCECWPVHFDPKGIWFD